MPERFDEAADDLRRSLIERHATEGERAILEAARDPETIVVQLGYDLGNGNDFLVMRPEGAEAVEAGEIGAPTDERSAAILRRIQARAALDLPVRRCIARRARNGCSCLEDALDALADREPTRDAVVAGAKELHREFVAEQRRQRRQLKQRLAESARRATAVLRSKEQPESPQAVAQRRPKASPKIEHTYALEEPHPLSPYAFRRSQKGGGDWLTRKF